MRPAEMTEGPGEAEAYAEGLLNDLAAWVERELTDAGYARDKDRFMPIHHDETCGISWAREKILAHVRELVP